MSEAPSPQRSASTRPRPASGIPRWDAECDVVVVGFGAAGASAAIEAANAGAKVILVEVASGSGGTSAMAGGDIYMGGNGGTEAQRANGFHDTTEDFFRYMMMAGGPDADEERVRLYAEGAHAHFQWLKDQGVPYRNTYIPGKPVMPGTGDCLILSGSEYAWPFKESARPCPRGHLPEAIGETGGFMLLDKLAKRVHALGVDVRFQTRARALVVDEANRVCGLVVYADGEEKAIRARHGVILCAGGFALNEDMLRQYAPIRQRLANDGLSGGYDDGSGIRLGMSVGGAAIHMDELFVTLPFYPPESHVKGILVNDKGARFINEDAYGGRVAHFIASQIGDRFFLLVDDAIFQQPSPYAKIEIAAVGSTWEEVERELGLSEGSLVSTVEVYNRHAAKGEDPLFHKDASWLKPLDEPPFAALACHLKQAYYPFFTLGGLRVRPSGEVLTIDGDVIPGLYAAGRTACGLPRWGKGYSSGMSLGDCTFFGRMAGRKAAATPIADA
ncbi:MAG: FAD-dependent oxidoreductase [Deltaproteobacteria bacterium]|nr:FAD-dependent oxidoreductase [Deltaproteobacteria bacterium]